MIKDGTKRIWKNVINEKPIQAANFKWSTYLLIMVDTLLLRTSLHTLHFTQLHFTPLHYIFRRFISSHLNFTQLHFTLLHYTCRHFTSSHLNFTQLPHFTALSFGLAPFQFHIVFNKSQPTLFHQPILAVLNNPDRTCLLFGNKPRIKTNKTQFYWIAHRDNFIGEFGLKEW